MVTYDSVQYDDDDDNILWLHFYSFQIFPDCFLAYKSLFGSNIVLPLLKLTLTAWNQSYLWVPIFYCNFSAKLQTGLCTYVGLY